MKVACVAVLLLALLAAVSARRSPFGAKPTVLVSNITISPPSYVDPHSFPEIGQICAVGSNVYMSASFSQEYVESYVYQFDVNLNLTYTLNLTSIDAYSFLGYSLFGVATTNSLYVVGNHKVLLVSLANTTNLQVVTVANFTDGTLFHGFPSTDGTQIFVFYNNYTDHTTGFLSLDATTLNVTGYYQVAPPKGFDWDYTPECQASPNNYTAYCQVGYRNYDQTQQLIQMFSLYNFTVEDETTLADYMDTAPLGYEGSCEVWSTYKWYTEDGYYNFNVTGLSPNLDEVWSTLLPSNTVSVDGVVVVGGSVLVSLGQTQAKGVLSGQIYQYDSETGAYQTHYPNNLPYVVKWNYNSTPNPYILSGVNQNLYSIGVATHPEDPNYLVRWEF